MRENTYQKEGKKHLMFIIMKGREKRLLMIRGRTRGMTNLRKYQTGYYKQRLIKPITETTKGLN